MGVKIVLSLMAMTVAAICSMFLIVIGVEIAKYLDYEIPEWLKKIAK